MLEMIVAGMPMKGQTNKLLVGDAIPKGNGMLWHISEDFKWFQEKTKEKILLVGETTSNFMPIDKIDGTLGRKVIVLKNKEDSDKIIQEVKQGTKKEYIVCGGLTIYQYFLKNVHFDKIYLTSVNSNIEYTKPEKPLFLDVSLLEKYKTINFKLGKQVTFFEMR